MKKRAYLYIKNDDVNSYETVIHALMVICGHNTYQAEQCATIIDKTGEYCVDHGTVRELQFKCSEMIKLGIDAEIRVENPIKK